MNELYFRVNAGIKNIIGKELIYSDNIAVIELVKNSKDANATNVDVIFNEEQSPLFSEIIIKDNGKGMTDSEIKNKWLNIAYSEKKDSTDGKLYAGNKGVGRFSCDRLGSRLELYTKSLEGDYLKLSIDWRDYENKALDIEMTSIPVYFEKINKERFLKENNLEDFTTGTILKIKLLREIWTTNKLKKLISELEKFSPSLEDDFTIKVFSANKDKDLINKLNKKINNNILEKVSFKTTYIKSEIDPKGKEIKTTLYYQGEKVYSYRVKNPYLSLKNISTELHYIDTISRTYFTKKIGISLVDYGSVFLFYNKFRISPYGNPKNDWLGIDQRKGQGRARYLGSRELFGRVDILDKDNTFNVMTNREGLAQNKAFHELIAYEHTDKIIISSDDDEENTESETYGYITTIIRQLENFVVEALEWNRFIDLLQPDSKKVISSNDLLKEPKRYKMKEIESSKIKFASEKLLKSSWNIKHIEINEDLIKNISDVANTKHQEFLKDFEEKVGDKTFSELSKNEQRKVVKIIEESRKEVKKAKNEKFEANKKRLEAEADSFKKSEEIIKKNKTIEQVNSINTFLKKTSNQDIEDLLISMHSILVNTSTIRNNILLILRDKNIDESLKNTILRLAEANQRNFNIAKFATLYNFTDKQNIINGEITSFIDKYFTEAKNFESNKKILIENELDLNITINKEFIPLELMMMLENILVNSQKSKASVLKISNKISNNGEISFLFSDNGNGITNERYLENLDLIFQKGETSTNGSGIGLFQVKKTVDKLSGKIYIKEHKNGFALEIKI